MRDNIKVVQCDKSEADFYSNGVWYKCENKNDTKAVKLFLMQNPICGISHGKRIPTHYIENVAKG